MFLCFIDLGTEPSMALGKWNKTGKSQTKGLVYYGGWERLVCQ